MNLVTLSNICYLSPSNHQRIIDDISFSIKDKTITTIIGPNGAGKSTLLRLILGLLSPSSGTILRDQNIKLGYMPQRLNLNNTLPLTVERFLSLSKSDRNVAGKIMSTLKQVRAEHTLRQSVHALSGGEWQRILLARALLQSPNLLVLDEPVQGLDLNGQVEFYQMLRHIRQTLECAVIHVSHDLHLVWDASDTIICLNKHICCMGHPETVRKNPDVLRLFGGFLPYTHHHDHHHDHCHDDGIDHFNSENSHV